MEGVVDLIFPRKSAVFGVFYGTFSYEGKIIQ